MTCALFDNNHRMKLFLFGSGHRATLFHLGALRRLNDFGLLPRLTTIYSMSGGAICAGLLAARWDLLGFDESGVTRKFQQEIEFDLLDLTSANVIENWSVLGTLRKKFRSTRIDRRHRRSIPNTTLGKVSNGPEFVFLARNPEIEMSERFTNRDGSLYDSGIFELTAEDSVLVSDASSALQKHSGQQWWKMYFSAEPRRRGARWDMANDLKQYSVNGALNCPLQITAALAKVPDDLAGIRWSQQQDLIDWGFASCDAALRASFEDLRHNEPDASPHGTFYAEPPAVAEVRPASSGTASGNPVTGPGIPQMPAVVTGTPSAAPENRSAVGSAASAA